MAEIRFEDRGMVVDTGYNRAFHAWFKANIPHADRKWNGVVPTEYDKTWTVHPSHFETLKKEITKAFGWCDVVGSPPGNKVERKQFVLDYIGRLYDRGSGEPTASGYAMGGWKLVFPASVLTAWFGFTINERLSTDSLYSILSVPETASDSELKKAFRRAARTYHPDYNKELNAAETFIKIREAYDLLSDSRKRAHYDAIRAMTEGYDAAELVEIVDDKEVLWKPPIHCGVITAKVDTATTGRWIIKEILGWDDQINALGETRVTYWIYGDESYSEKWIM